ncbi:MULTISPECIES: MBL fold metallo-hydrolase [Virgibacillus]|uniref:MBL fold metallo-hydrolase n=1 Tax=Virgibacillus dokdonensis TaxID=302167 RepID=A0A2K9J3J4_9BACI|nr:MULTISPECIES: MBL fold metallo-hydrolase [Virgibacillus]AUJ26274.1 putative metallo-hydrolase [Virgibacillus dokdonensis]NWO13566.1 MBL fold metallo-hydrolase [Virgibacillus sp.]
MHIHAMSLGPLGTNCYIVYDQEEALIIDPGGDAEKVTQFLQDHHVTPIAILLTHAHFDHIGAVDGLRKAYHIDVYLHELEANWLEDASKNGSLLFTQKKVETERPDQFLYPRKMALGDFSFHVLHTPGHSPGSVTFVFTTEKFIISGDVLFQQGIGRTDLPGGDFQQLEKSIKESIYTLDDAFIVYPGHGPKTNIQFEKQYNPFFTV